jgi:Na+-translocating ferredoxin:NAD+ oxidoreductase RnfD subunit
MQTAVDSWYQNKRLGGLWRFAISLSLLNILGHTLFGFEQAWAHPIVALAAAYGMELSIEATKAWSERRRPKFLGSVRTFVEFLLSAHITGLAVSMLLYANERFWVVAFAAAVAVGSKELFQVQVPVPGRPQSAWAHRHFLNPSNFGITCTLLLFPWVGIAPPYQFTEALRGPLDVLLPLFIICVGSFLNTRFTERIVLIGAWLVTFFLQAVVRALSEGLPVAAALMPMTGFAFILFTFYMVTDPGTTPSNKRDQVLFGAAVAIIYGLLVRLHVVFGLFFALTIVTACRGAAMHWAVVRALAAQRSARTAPTPALEPTR